MISSLYYFTEEKEHKTKIKEMSELRKQGVTLLSGNVPL